MGEWREVRIGDFLHRVKQPVQLQDDKNYKLVTVRMHHNGVVLRELKKGKLIGSNMYRVKSGQFILSGIDARHGAFGVVPVELDDAVVTNDFWYFDVDENVVSRDFFLWLTTTPIFLDACIKSSEGTTNRRRLQGDKFFNFSFHFPKIDEQKRLAERFNAVDTTFAAMKYKFEQQSEYLKQLRQAVLQEAIEGKLTAEWRKKHPVMKGDPQYDAAALLAQIKAEKERMVKEGKIRKEKPLPPITDTDKPFDLPEGWVWCRLGELSELITSGSRDWASFYRDDGRAKFVRMGNLSHDSYQLKQEKIQRVEPPVTGEGTRTKLVEGDLLISITGDVGWMGLIPADFGEAYINQHTSVVRLIPILRTTLIPKFLLSPLGRKQFNEPQRGIKNSFRLTDLFELLLPLPPLAEQQAIVARVNSLMAVIDELEKQATERKDQARLLMQAVLREAFE